MSAKNEKGSTTADRQITITRLLNAPRELVFELWTKPEHIKHWWGPTGFTNTISKMDVKPGGEWEFVMHGPDGTDYKNRHVFEEIIWPEKIVLQHASGPNFKMTITFTAQGDKTLLHITSLFESAEQLKEVVRLFKADEGLKQNVDRLEQYLVALPAKPVLVLTRIINAPREVVFKAWTDPAQVAKWWGPNMFTSKVRTWDAQAGGKIDLDMNAVDGTGHPMGGTFHVIDEPRRLVFTSTAFKDKEGNNMLEVLNTVTFEDYQGKTKLTLIAEVKKHGAGTEMALAGMNEGWSQSLDRLISVTDNRSPKPLVIERTYNAPVEKVWKAITDISEMKKWYFDLPEFNPEVGFGFQFNGGPDGRLYLHLCKITEVVPGKKLTYSWRYDGYDGNSFVTWELFDEGEKTRLILTHTGLETFPAENADFAKHNFVAGWTHIIGKSLKEFVEATG